MTSPRTTESVMPSKADMIALAQRLTAHSSRMLAHTLSGKDHPPAWGLGSADPLGLGDAVPKLMTSLASEPMPFVEMQASLAQDLVRLSQRMALRMIGLEQEPLAEPEPDDRRFTDSRWQENPYFDMVKQAYLLATEAWVAQAIAETGASSMSDMGRVMGALMKAHKGSLDGKLANQLVRKALS